jgi:hypothetical protein
MGSITTIVTKYGFNKPSIFSEEEFKSYKQILSVEPTYNLSPKSDFWNEFSIIKWLLIIFVLSFAIGLIADIEFLGIIGILSFAFLLLITLSGEGSSMLSYNKYETKKNEYFEKLKAIIIKSSNYEEFVFHSKKI